jgi:hypothetical protein
LREIEETRRLREAATASLGIGDAITRNASAFDALYRETTALRALDAFAVPKYLLHNPLEQQKRFERRWREDFGLVCVELPKRGWYLHGNGSCRDIYELARLIREHDEPAIDALPKFNTDALRTWLASKAVPPYCVKRLFKFLGHHDDGNWEEAVTMGIPLLDEITKLLVHRKKSFTTKRGKGKPDIGYRTVDFPGLDGYYDDFVQAVGVLQADVRPDLFSNPEYWNRHAIVHGLMEREMGPKDSAKCLMAIGFILAAAQARDERPFDSADGADGDCEADDLS